MEWIFFFSGRSQTLKHICHRSQSLASRASPSSSNLPKSTQCQPRLLFAHHHKKHFHHPQQMKQNGRVLPLFLWTQQFSKTLQQSSKIKRSICVPPGIESRWGWWEKMKWDETLFLNQDIIHHHICRIFSLLRFCFLVILFLFCFFFKPVYQDKQLFTPQPCRVLDLVWLKSVHFSILTI